jgi:hypothetical protein
MKLCRGGTFAIIVDVFIILMYMGNLKYSHEIEYTTDP